MKVGVHPISMSLKINVYIRIEPVNILFEPGAIHKHRYKYTRRILISLITTDIRIKGFVLC
jgi:hypothetical protein